MCGYYVLLIFYNNVYLSLEKVVFWEILYKLSLRFGSCEFIVVEGREFIYLLMEKFGYFFI